MNVFNFYIHILFGSLLQLAVLCRCLCYCCHCRIISFTSICYFFGGFMVEKKKSKHVTRCCIHFGISWVRRLTFNLMIKTIYKSRNKVRQIWCCPDFWMQLHYLWLLSVMRFLLAIILRPPSLSFTLNFNSFQSIIEESSLFFFFSLPPLCCAYDFVVAIAYSLFNQP